MSTRALAGLRILIVEDEFLIAMDVEQLCRDHGAREVTIHASVAELLADPAASAGYDAAVIDVIVEGGPTVELARRLKAECVPFIFATGYSEREEIFREFPEAIVVGKPYSESDIVDGLARAVAQAREGHGSGRDV